MKFILAPDSFKESMSSKEVAKAMEKGIRRVIPDANCIKVPMADGGEGTTSALVASTGGKVYKTVVTGPLGGNVLGEIGILGDKETAVMEMASASGLSLISRKDRNPMKTTTYGTGELIKKALDMNIKNLLIGIGGSSTNDGGAGMFQALGGKLLDKNGDELLWGGGELGKVHSIDMSGLDRRILNFKIEVACDVSNPLTGENGASFIFAPQKGGTEEMVGKLDDNLKHYADVIRKELRIDIEMIEGAGAAGGLGAGLIAFLNAKLVNGVDLIIKHTDLEKEIKDADYVFTGEGRIDSQTIYGKTPVGISKLAKKYNVPTIVVAGSIGAGIEGLYKHGVTSIIGVLDSPCTLPQALLRGRNNIERTSENIARLLE